MFSDKIQELIKKVAVPTQREWTEFKIVEEKVEVVMKCRVVNEAKEENVGSPVLMVRLAEARNYEKFLEYRKKVKRL